MDGYPISLVVAVLAATAALLAPSAIAAPPAGSPVTITDTFLSCQNGTFSGTFQANAPLCAGGTVTQDRAFKLTFTHTCADGSGTFRVTLQGSSSQHKWSFVDGTGAYGSIKGSGQYSHTCTGSIPCQLVLSGSATL